MLFVCSSQSKESGADSERSAKRGVAVEVSLKGCMYMAWQSAVERGVGVVDRTRAPPVALTKAAKTKRARGACAGAKGDEAIK